MRGFIIILAMLIPAPAGFALSFTSGRSGPTAPANLVQRPAPARSASPAATRSSTLPSAASASPVSARDKSLLARVTVYWASGGRGSDRYTRQHKTATGLRLRHGHCAVDPRHIPYGSKVVFPDGTALAAVDTGTAVKNRKAARKSGRTVNERNAVVVDRFFETKRQALAWARTHPLFMPVRVVSPNYRSVRPPQPARVVANNSLVGPILKAQPVSQARGQYRLVASNESTAKDPLKKVRR